MTGRNHAAVPGRDTMPLIDVKDGVCGSVLIVQNFDGVEVLRVGYPNRGKACGAEAKLRSDLARARNGDVVAVLNRWRKEASDFPAWWEK